MSTGTPPSLTKTYSGSRGQVLMAEGLPLSNTLETYGTPARRKMAWGTNVDFHPTTNIVNPMTVSSIFGGSFADAPLICNSMVFTSGSEFRQTVGDNFLPSMRVRETSIGSYKAQISEAPLLITSSPAIQAGYKLIESFVSNKLLTGINNPLDAYASRIALKTSIYNRWLLFVLNSFQIKASGIGSLAPISFNLNLEGILPGSQSLASQLPNRYMTTSTTDYMMDDQSDTAILADVTGSALLKGGRLANIKDCYVIQGVHGSLDQVVEISLEVQQKTKLASTARPEDAGFLPRHADHIYVVSRDVKGSLAYLSSSVVGGNAGNDEGQGLLNLRMGPMSFIMPNAFWTNTVTTLSTGVPITVMNFLAKGVSLTTATPPQEIDQIVLCREFA